MNKSMMDPNAMQPAYPDFTNGSDNRNAISYMKALEQFHLETNPRYTPRDVTGTGRIDTFCNIFLWDGSRALGCEIPHFRLFYKANGGQIILTGEEFNANRVAAWFAGKADEEIGWVEVSDRGGASIRANKGYPTVVIWNNPKGIGHVAFVLPGDSIDTRIAQAGASNFFNGHITKGFGNITDLKFYTHD
jgi:hypothetical protein